MRGFSPAFLALILGQVCLHSCMAGVRVAAPLLMLHGTQDDTVPIEVGRKLRDAAPPGVRWVELRGSHSRLHSQAPEAYQQALRQLISELKPPQAPTT